MKANYYFDSKSIDNILAGFSSLNFIFQTGYYHAFFQVIFLSMLPSGIFLKEY